MPRSRLNLFPLPPACPLVIPPFPRTAALLLALLVGGLLGAGCMSDESSSRAQPDSASASPAAPRPLQEAAVTTPTAPPPGGDRTVAQRLADASIAARAKRALAGVRSLRPFDFAPTAVRGHLFLRGRVQTRTQAQRALRVVEGLQGVARVTNQLAVQGRDTSARSGGNGSAYHTVRRGDTLSEIAREHDVSVRRLRTLNPLSGPLQPGQRLRVR